MARKIEIATLLAEGRPANRDPKYLRKARVASFMDRPKADLVALAIKRKLPMLPTYEAWYEVDGSAVPGGTAGQTWFAVYDIPETVPEDMLDGREDIALSYDDCPRYFTDEGRSAADREPDRHSV